MFNPTSVVVTSRAVCEEASSAACCPSPFHSHPSGSHVQYPAEIGDKLGHAALGFPEVLGFPVRGGHLEATRGGKWEKEG